jgi:hypothetical protein
MAEKYLEIADIRADTGYGGCLAAGVTIGDRGIRIEIDDLPGRMRSIHSRQYIDTPLPRDFAIRLRDALTVALDRTDPEKMGRDRVAGGMT